MIAEAAQVTYPPFLDGVYDFPLLLQYGDADPLIPVEVVRQVPAQVRDRWGDPDKLVLRTYPGVGHLTIAHDTASEVVRWITDRFAGVPPATSCDHTSTSATDVCATPVLADPSRMVPNPRPS